VSTNADACTKRLKCKDHGDVFRSPRRIAGPLTVRMYSAMR
jgi:hypothetical protein